MLTMTKRLAKSLATQLIAPRPRPRMARLMFRTLVRLKPGTMYQPVPWLNCHKSSRTEGTEARWKAVQDELGAVERPGTAMELGSHLGYFSLKMAEQGWLTLAVESNPATHRTAMLVQRATQIPTITHMNMLIGTDTVERLPQVDVVVFFSLWHHICNAEGLDNARKVLRAVLERTNKVCFFETGQSNEDYMKWSQGLPHMTPDPSTWLTGLLKECGAREVKSLGHFETFQGPVRREVFAAYTDGTQLSGIR